MTTPQPLPVPPPLPQGAEHFLKLTKQYGMYTGSALQSLIDMTGEPDIVDGWLAARSVNILVGDSGVGKTPLAYQLALSVAAGVPFLGASVRQGKVLFLDFENGALDWHRMLEQQRKFLGLAEYPSPNFVFWPVHSAIPAEEVREVVETMRPDLIVIDSLRSYCTSIESGNGAAAWELKQLRTLVLESGAAAVLIHHVHKRAGSSLDDNTALDWLRNAAGGRALVNQSDARLAVAASSRRASEVVLRGHLRTRGEIGPYYLQRRYDGDGEPLGYVRAEVGEAPELVGFPESFSYSDARELLGKCDATTNAVLRRGMQGGLIRKVARGKYVKCETGRGSRGTQ